MQLVEHSPFSFRDYRVVLPGTQRRYVQLIVLARDEAGTIGNGVKWSPFEMCRGKLRKMGYL